MPRVCTICPHPEHEAINQALVAGESAPKIAAKYRVSDDAITRHRAHVPATLAKATEAKETALADDLLAQVKALRNKSISILQKAEAAGDLRTALLGIREARACIELLAEMEGEINRNPTINIHVSAEWIAVRTVLLKALQSHPEARQAVAAALVEVEHGNG